MENKRSFPAGPQFDHKLNSGVVVPPKMMVRSHERLFEVCRDPCSSEMHQRVFGFSILFFDFDDPQAAPGCTFVVKLQANKRAMYNVGAKKCFVVQSGSKSHRTWHYSA